MWRKFILMLISVLPILSFAQPMATLDNNFGSTGWDELHKMHLLNDSTLLLAGNTAGTGGTIADTTYGQNDFWIQNSTLDGTILWSKLYGGLGEDRLWQVLPLASGQFLLCGDSDSGITGNKTSKGHGGLDYWVLLVDSIGDVVWEKSFGSSGDDRLFDACVHPDSGFVLAGFSDGPANGDKLAGSNGSTDVWILHIDEAGNIVWQKNYGGIGFDNAYQIKAVTTGGFLVAGASSSPKGGDVSQLAYGDTDIWLLRLDKQGEKLWDKRYGGAGSEQAYVLKPLKDGAWLLGGGSASQTSDTKHSAAYGSYDFWALKIRENGTIIWENTYGGSALDVLYDVAEAEDGSLYMGGVSDSPQGGLKKAQHIGGYDFYLLKTNPHGSLVWDATYGEAENDAMTQLLQLKNGAFLMGGHSNSHQTITKKSDTYGENDIWYLQTLCAADIDLPPQQIYCEGTTQEIEALSTCSSGCNILWNGFLGGLTHHFTVETAETLTAQLFDNDGCKAEATTSYSVHPPLDINIGPADTLVRVEQSLLLGTPASPGSTWLWNTGSDKAYIRSTESGLYSLTVTEATGCVGSDTIRVCHCLENKVYLPNAIQLNGNWLLDNDIWVVWAANGMVKNIDLVQVFSRDGNLIFESKDMKINTPSTGWDGRNKAGKILDAGVYTYLVQLSYENGEEDTIFGTVSIIR